MGESEVKGRSEIIQTPVLLKSSRRLSGNLEIWGDSNFKPPLKTGLKNSQGVE